MKKLYNGIDGFPSFNAHAGMRIGFVECSEEFFKDCMPEMEKEGIRVLIKTNMRNGILRLMVESMRFNLVRKWGQIPYYNLSFSTEGLTKVTKIFEG